MRTLLSILGMFYARDNERFPKPFDSKPLREVDETVLTI